jgi:hypothetical protein
LSPDAGVLEAPEVDQLETPETGTAEIPETPESDSGNQTIADPNAPKPTGLGVPAIKDGKLSEAARATLTEIKAKDPILAKELQRALFQADALRREVPGGLKEIQELKAKVEEFGGLDGVAKSREELAYFNDLDSQFTAGDPRFIQALIETPEGQTAFLKLAPQMFGKYAELHPEGHAQYLAQSFQADAAQEGIPLTIEKLAFFLQSGNGEQAALQVKALQQYFARIQGYASKQVTAPKFETQKDDREQQLAQREREFNRNEWKAATATEQRRVYAAEWARLTAGKKLTDQQTTTIQELFGSRMAKMIEQHKATLDKYFEAGDKAGFLRYANSISAREIPRILARSFEGIGGLGSKPGPKPGTKPAVAAPGTPTNGATWIPAAPHAGDINYKVTTTAMVAAGRAILKSGKTVQWKT